MIQAPNIQYIPAQMTAQPAYIPQGAPNNVQYPQNPGVIYNYPTASSYYPQSYCQGRSQYNGVNIEIINPQGQAGMPGAMPAQYMPMPAQYMQMPMANPYPVMQQPYVQPAPVQMPAAPVQMPAAPVQIPAAPVQIPAPQIVTPQAQTIPAAPVVQPQQPVNTPEVPQAAAPVVEPAAPVDPSLTPASFAARLKTDDLDAQKEAIEQIAETLKLNDKLAASLLDTQISDALVDIVDKDTSSLEGPTPEVIALREKPESELSEEEKAKAKTFSPLEKAVRNQQYALYTIAYLQERLNNELTKRGSSILELKDLPQIEKVVDTVKSNPNPHLRSAALAALAHIARPEYKEDLTTLFEIAKSDEDPGVQEAANKAMEMIK